MKPDQQIECIRAKQLEERYGIDRITGWRWVRDKSKAIHLAPNVSVFDRAEIDAWFEAREGGGFF